jgi:hypothetical protein
MLNQYPARTKRSNTESSPSILPILVDGDFSCCVAHPPINQGHGLPVARRLSPPSPLLRIYHGVEAFSHLINLMVRHGVEQR